MLKNININASILYLLGQKIDVHVLLPFFWCGMTSLVSFFDQLNNPARRNDSCRAEHVRVLEIDHCPRGNNNDPLNDLFLLQ